MRRLLLVGTLLQAAGTLGLQLLAMVTLEPTQFGAFSLVYLVFAFGNSLALSVLLDPWLAARRGDSPASVDDAFAPVLGLLALAAAVVAGVMAFAMSGSWLLAVVGMIAASAALYRAGWRYRAAAERRMRPMVLGDSLALAAVGAGAVSVLVTGGAELLHIFIVWAAAALASALIHPLPRTLAPARIRAWVSGNRSRIRILLADSLLMDLGAIGTPYVIGGIAGLAALGVYRGVSNVAAPVRLILNPLRPILADAEITRRRWASIVLLGFALGAAAWVALWLIGLLRLDLGTLSTLVALALPAAIFVTANCVGHASYLIARGRARGRGLLLGRVLQTLLALAVPITGSIIGGVPGAAWGLAVATACSAPVWMLIAIRGGSLRDPV